MEITWTSSFPDKPHAKLPPASQKKIIKMSIWHLYFKFFIEEGELDGLTDKIFGIINRIYFMPITVSTSRYDAQISGTVIEPEAMQA